MRAVVATVLIVLPAATAAADLEARRDSTPAAPRAGETRWVAQAPGSRPIAFTRLFTAGAGRGGRLADPSSEFSPDEPTIHVRFAYEGGVPGEELRSRWLFLTPSGGQEFSQAVVTLQRAADLGQFSFSPAEGTRWLEGTYRVQILGRGVVLAEVDFLVRAPQVATLPPAPAPIPPPASAPPGPLPGPPPPAPGPPPAAGPVTVVNAVLARDIENGQPKDPGLEFTTARKRLILWAQVQAAGGGALTARWYAAEGGDRLLGEHTLALPPGESRVAYWLEVADDKVKFKRGRFRVDLIADNQVVQQLPFRIRQAGFLEELSEALDQFGKDLDKLSGERKP